MHFTIVLPLRGLIETHKPVPNWISEAVLKSKAKAAVAILAFVLGLGGLLGSSTSLSAAEQEKPPELTWSFSGPFGKFDRAQLQRGFKVYREVCQNCHSLKLLSLRNLGEPGGPEFSAAQVESIAAEYKVKDTNDQGEPIERPGRPADHFPPPFENDAQARQVTAAPPPPPMSVLPNTRGYKRAF